MDTLKSNEVINKINMDQEKLVPVPTSDENDSTKILIKPPPPPPMELPPPEIISKKEEEVIRQIQEEGKLSEDYDDPVEQQKRLLESKQDKSDVIYQWKVEQEKLRDPRRFIEKRKRKVLKVSRKRRRISYWDLTPEDMHNLGVGVRNLVGIPAFGIAPPSKLKNNAQLSLGGAQTAQQILTDRQSKRIYVGCIPNTVTEEDLRAFFNAELMTKGLIDSSQGQPVIGCKINYQKNFCFLDFRSESEATKCLNLNGLKLQDCTLRIRRPTDYSSMQGLATTNAIKKRAQMSKKDCAIADILNLSMRVESGIFNFRNFFKLKIVPTKILVLMNMIKIEDYVKDDDYISLAKDVKQEVEKYGQVQKIVIPRPHRDGFKTGFGKIFVQYSSVQNSENAMKMLRGRKFQGRVVITSFHNEEDFSNKIF